MYGWDDARQPSLTEQVRPHHQHLGAATMNYTTVISAGELQRKGGKDWKRTHTRRPFGWRTRLSPE